MMKKCEKCGWTTDNKDAVFCENCGGDMITEEGKNVGKESKAEIPIKSESTNDGQQTEKVVAAAQVPYVNKAGIVCSKKKKKIQSYYHYCSYCGYDLNNLKSNIGELQLSHRTLYGKFISVLNVITILFVIAILFSAVGVLVITMLFSGARSLF